MGTTSKAATSQLISFCSGHMLVQLSSYKEERQMYMALAMWFLFWAMVFLTWQLAQGVCALASSCSHLAVLLVCWKLLVLVTFSLVVFTLEQLFLAMGWLMAPHQVGASFLKALHPWLSTQSTFLEVWILGFGQVDPRLAAFGGTWQRPPKLWLRNKLGQVHGHWRTWLPQAIQVDPCGKIHVLETWAPLLLAASLDYTGNLAHGCS